MENTKTENGSCYALICPVGVYDALGLPELQTWKGDAKLMQHGLCSGLKFRPENIRVTGKQGYVSAAQAAGALADFSNLLKAEDVFLFYFSGHGSENVLFFSDFPVSMQSLFDYIEKLPCKSKAVILDCCCAGAMRTGSAKQPDMTKSLAQFAGAGIAVLASSAAGGVSRSGPDGNASLYTELLSSAMCSEAVVRNGKISLKRLADETAQRMRFWNTMVPQRAQQSIFRSSMGGTVYFTVEPDKEKLSANGNLPEYIEREDYTLCSIKSLSTAQVKRLAAFVIPKKAARLQELAQFTQKIVRDIKYAPVYNSEKFERIYGNSPAKVIWCYFAADEEDIIRNLYYAYTIWTDDEAARRTLFRKSKHAFVQDGIYIWNNSAYGILHRQNDAAGEENGYENEAKELLGTLVSMGEDFISALQRIENNETTIIEVKEKYTSWIGEVKRRYLRLTSLPLPPAELQKWADSVEKLCGCILDLAILLDNTSQEQFNKRERYLMQYSVNAYYECLDLFK